ncbi:hypothetical protein ACFYYS_20140 [Streptomyces sp. NPDC002120]|uniref:hypothetical protein n=1 Tax=Streptomyces sp. NPDC002120 TaxID=3364631 RepID=UPI0036B273C6
MFWPHQVGVIPRRADCFQHRQAVDEVRMTLADAGTAVLGQVLAGMGGVGKTQLAADCARTAWQDSSLDLLVQITASARSPAVTGYAQAGVEAAVDPGRLASQVQPVLGAPGRRRDRVGPLAGHRGRRTAAARAVRGAPVLSRPGRPGHRLRRRRLRRRTAPEPSPRCGR